MISHKYKCIFIHIPRTAGTAIEKWICGDDWWYIEKETKHLLASQAKKIYQEYWDSYFKFSFVRNPWDRMVSCLGAYEDFFKISCKEFLNIDGYKKEFGYPITIENDYRFSKKNDIQLEKHQEHSVYLNILDENLDFIGKFESLRKDTEFIKKRLKIEKDFPFTVKDGASKRKDKYQDYYDDKARRDVEELFRKDIKKFRYRFNDEVWLARILKRIFTGDKK
jgi:hypothetical protein